MIATGLADLFWPRRNAPPPQREREWSRAFDLVGSVIAAAALVTVAGASLIEQTADPVGTGAATQPASPATASTSPTSEFMFAGYLGAPYTYPSDVTVRSSGPHDFTVKHVDWEGKPFAHPIYYGARIVRWFDGGRTGAMLDFTHSKTIALLQEEKTFKGTIGNSPAPARAKLGDIFRHLEASHGHNMLTLNGLLRLPSLGAWLHPYVGLGAGIALPHSEVHLIKDPDRTYEYQYAGPVGQALVGIEIRLPRVSYFVEYKFSLASYEMPLTHTDGSILFFDLWRQFQRWWSGEEPPGGFLDTRLTSHQVIAGVGVRSATAPSAAAP